PMIKSRTSSSPDERLSQALYPGGARSSRGGKSRFNIFLTIIDSARRAERDCEIVGHASKMRRGTQAVDPPPRNPTVAPCKGRRCPRHAHLDEPYMANTVAEQFAELLAAAGLKRSH